MYLVSVLVVSPSIASFVGARREGLLGVVVEGMNAEHVCELKNVAKKALRYCSNGCPRSNSD